MEDPPEALFRFFEAMPRQGPGSDEVTARILEGLRPQLPGNPLAADMGSGDGAAALVLAEAGLHVTAVDIWRPFLDRLKERAAAAGFEERIATRESSMLESRIGAGSLDLIWSEGSVFTVGFDAALTSFAKLLKPGGWLVVSECSWLVQTPPDEARAFWQRSYPAMRSAAGNIEAALAAGWTFHAAHKLPPEVWETNFYGPMEQLMLRLAKDPDMEAVIEENRDEINVFRTHGDSYGYVFYEFQSPRIPAP